MDPFVHETQFTSGDLSQIWVLIHVDLTLENTNGHNTEQASH